MKNESKATADLPEMAVVEEIVYGEYSPSLKLKMENF